MFKKKIIITFLFTFFCCKDLKDPSTDCTSLLKIHFKSKTHWFNYNIIDIQPQGSKQKISPNYNHKHIYTFPLNPYQSKTTFHVNINHNNKTNTTTIPIQTYLLTITYHKKKNFLGSHNGMKQHFILQDVKMENITKNPIIKINQTKINNKNLHRRIALPNVEIFFTF